MIDGQNLHIGKAYFIAGYCDGGMRVPDIETYIFIGKNMAEEDSNRNQDSWYFQTPESYFSDGIITEIKGNIKDKVLLLGSDVLDMVYDLDGLIVFLNSLKNSYNQGSTNK